MAWEKVREHLDEAQGMHLIVMADSTAPAIEHHIMIHVGVDCCPTCGHVRPKDNLDEIDPKAHVEAIRKTLNVQTDAMRAYARKHRIQVKKG